MDPETAEVLALAREWRAGASDDLWSSGQFRMVNRFLKLWVALNALYALRVPDTRGDRAQLKQFAAWPPVTAAHRRLVQEQTYGHAVRSIASGVFKYQTHKVLTVTDLADAQAVLDSVYQVRCNLFHGKKSPTNLRDAQLVNAAATIVTKLLDALLTQDAIWGNAAA